MTIEDKIDKILKGLTGLPGFPRTGKEQTDFYNAKHAIRDLLKEANRDGRISELELLKPKLIGGAREYHKGDSVSINYERGYKTAQDFLLNRISELEELNQKGRTPTWDGPMITLSRNDINNRKLKND